MILPHFSIPWFQGRKRVWCRNEIALAGKKLIPGRHRRLGEKQRRGSRRQLRRRRSTYAADTWRRRRSN